MKVLFVTSEVSGLFKKGGLGDVSHELPLALSRLGVDVSVILPFYEDIKLRDVSCVGQIAVDFSGIRETVFVFRSQIGNGHGTVPCYLLRHPRLNTYAGDKIEEMFAFFSLAVAHFYLYAPHVLGGIYDVIHCNDWHTSLVPMILGERNKVQSTDGRMRAKNQTSRKNQDTFQSLGTRSVITIHNLLYQGDTGEKLIEKIGLPKALFHVYRGTTHNYLKILREGLEYADAVTTVSPTYAKEITTGGFGEHMDKVLAERSDRVTGILNGIDTSLWDPASDPTLAHKYNHINAMKVKPLNRAALARAVGIPDDGMPIFGFIGRIEARQKGTDLIREAVEYLMDEQSAQCISYADRHTGKKSCPFHIVLLGTGQEEEIEKLKVFVKRYPNAVFVNAFDEVLARKIYAGSDIMLIPSRFEPCGLIQLIAMRYGAIPIVRNTGGLADSVEDGETGFTFEEYDPKELARTMAKALVLRGSDPKAWEAMVRQAMKKDFGWDASAKQYMALYVKLIKR
jgi:starch synthase